MRPGDRINGRFELIQPVGRGATGTVYRAVDVSSDEPVALKLLRGGLDDDDERFRREADLLARLSHPAVVRYVAHGTTATGDRFLAMEWLEGQPLSQVLEARGSLDIGDVLKLGCRVCDALARAHSLGVIHRDLKPSNLFLKGGHVDQVKILDFGAALWTEASLRLTNPGMPVGTPGYMAPEQAQGIRDVDERADLFSLGCVLFECLVGRPAFVAKHAMALLAKILLEEPPSVADHRQDVPAALVDLVDAMMAKPPDGRPASAKAVRAALEAIEREGDKAAVAARPARAPALTEREQRLVSLVVAAPDPSGAEVAVDDSIPVLEDTERLPLLRSAASPFDVRLEMLADGTAIGVVSGTDAITEELVRAARCALAIQACSPQLRVVLATGRAEMAGHLPMGAVIDRAVDQLRRTPRQAVRLDDLSASLLERRFDLEVADDGTLLVGERESLMVSRRLLGRPVACVGRRRELALLESTYRACVSDPGPQLVMVTGPAGVGKSRLCKEFLIRLRKAGERLFVLVGRGDSLSAGSTFGLLSQLVRASAGIRPGDPDRLQRRKLRHRATQLLPAERRAAVCEALGDLVGTAPADPGRREQRVGRTDTVVRGDQIRAALTEWLAAICGQRPVVLVLDDLHFGDGPTVQFIDAAIRALKETPLMVLGLGRPEVKDRFPRLWSTQRLTELVLGPLSRRASRRLVRQALAGEVEPEEVERIVERAGGNAFFLEELVRAVVTGSGEAGTADSALGMVQNRLDGVAPQARRLLRAASIFGQTFWVGGVAELLGRDRSAEVAEWLGGLEADEIIVSEPDGSAFPGERQYRFRNELVRSAAYATLTPEDLALGHRLAGEWLERVGERNSLVLAEHFERGRLVARAAVRYLSAAEEALAGHDLEASRRRAERGLACHPAEAVRAALHLILAEVHRWRGNNGEARAAAQRALELSRPGTSVWFRALAELIIALGRSGGIDELETWVAALRDQGPLEGEPKEPRALALCEAVTQLLMLGRTHLADRYLAEAEKAAGPVEACEPRLAGRLRATQAYRAVHGGDLASALRLCESAAERYEAAGDLRNQAQMTVNLGAVLLQLGEYERADEVLRRSLELAGSLELADIVAFANHNLSVALARRGQRDQAVALAREALAWMDKKGDLRTSATARVYLADVLLEGDQYDEAEAEARAALEALGSFPHTRAHALTMLARVLLLRGRTEEALETAREAHTLLELLGRIEAGETLLRLTFAEALQATGRKKSARTAIDHARKHLLARGALISDVELRQAFLHQVPENARIQQLYERWTGSS